MTPDAKAKPDDAVQLAEWSDSRVQVVYALLCDDETWPPPDEHWEGFVARRIVAALFPAPVSEDE